MGIRQNLLAALTANSVPPGPYTTGGVTFDGAATALSNAALTCADSFAFSASFWVNWTADNINGNPLMVVDPLNLYLSAIYANDSAGSLQATEFNMWNTADILINCKGNDPDDLAEWYHYLFSCNCNFPAGEKQVKILRNGVDVTTLISDANDAATITMNGLPLWIGSDNFGFFNGSLADVWIAPGQSLLDMSGNITSPTLAKFYDSVTGKPVNLGTDGSAPTGTAPAVFLRRAPSAAASTFADNLGPGGNFSIAGTLIDAPSSPSD